MESNKVENTQIQQPQNIQNDLQATSESEHAKIKFARQNIKQQYYTQDNYDPAADHRLTQYIDTALSDISNFLNSILGRKYTPKNDFKMSQKQKIMRYIYSKNKQMAEVRYKPKNEEYLTSYDKESMDIWDAQQRVTQTERIAYENRVGYVNEVAKCHNKLRFTGFMWGTTVAGIIWQTFMKKSNITRKFAMFIFCFHLGGQYASFRNNDLVFDSCYPLFEQDIDDFIESEEQRRREGLTQELRKDDIDILINKKLRKLNKKYKDDIENLE